MAKKTIQLPAIGIVQLCRSAGDGEIEKAPCRNSKTMKDLNWKKSIQKAHRRISAMKSRPRSTDSSGTDLIWCAPFPGRSRRRIAKATPD